MSTRLSTSRLLPLLSIALLAWSGATPLHARQPAQVLQGVEGATPAPRVLLVAQNSGTEITDLLVPWAILSAAGAQVTVTAPQTGAVELWPALTLTVETPLEDAGPADLIVVPAVRDPGDRRLHDWLAARHARGAAVASICDGVLVLAEAGLLEGRSATGHFYSHARRVRDYPAVHWLRDRRWVEDAELLSSAGVSASGPAAIRLVERMFGPAHAGVVARRFGIVPGVTHRSDDFRIGSGEVLTAIGNLVRGVRKRAYVLPVADGVDEYSLAFTVDMLARTSRARVELLGEGSAVRTAFGLRLETRSASRRGTRVYLPHALRDDGGSLVYTTPATDGHAQLDAGAALSIEQPASAIERLHAHLAEAFGARTAAFVATQLELPAPR